MKTQKLNLNQIKVESFVTEIEAKQSATVNGAGTGWWVGSALLPLGCVVAYTMQGEEAVNSREYCAHTYAQPGGTSRAATIG